MKRTLLALVAATFAFAAGSSFAQAPADPVSPAPVVTKSKAKAAKPAAKHSKAHKTTSHKVAHKSGKVHVAHKKSAKSTHAA
ncbi:hypothetical protein QTH90_10020 [Variovorax sp. J2P1-59]|uniref:hypothetical protein n=1 Tax=Variovorax flavidus TaxID=3053501 RepID=UPI0025757B16|nr:hypothetical protein [Variovorax sp. J2P1-59]MDM0074718.1 hypothetical protein [Variovorax sp. J2P1-59]